MMPARAVLVRHEHPPVALNVGNSEEARNRLFDFYPTFIIQRCEVK